MRAAAYFCLARTLKGYDKSTIATKRDAKIYFNMVNDELLGLLKT